MASSTENKIDSETNNVEGFQSQEGSSSFEPNVPTASKGESSKKGKSEGNEEFFYRLFKFPNAGEQYLLEIHEVKTSSIERCHVSMHHCNEGWKVIDYDLVPGDHVVVPVLEDPTQPIFPKRFGFSLQERLNGWTIEKRKRDNGKEDKFYYHRGRQFRSFVEVMTFILYSCRVKDLKIIC